MVVNRTGPRHMMVDYTGATRRVGYDISERTETTASETQIVMEIDEGDEDEEDYASVMGPDEDEDDPSIVEDVAEMEAEIQEEVYDTQYLHKVIEDAGRWAFGIILTELWVLDDTGTMLFRPDCGWWMDTYADKDNTFSRLIDESHPDYLPADPVMPGIGLTGYLWSQATGRNGGHATPRHSRGSRSSFAGRSSFFGGRGLDESQASRPSMLFLHNHSMDSDVADSRFRGHHHPHMTWCEVKPLADDPMQPYDERTQYLAKAGLGLAAGVPFSIGGTRGIVVYMARDTANLKELTDSTNEEYLQRATSVIASSFALRRARIAVVRKRKQDINACWRRVRIKLLAIRFMGLTLAEAIKREEQKKVELRPQSAKDVIRKVDGTLDKISAYVKGKIQQEATKFMGANIKAPPPFGWMASFFTFTGVFLTLAMLTNVSAVMVNSFGPDFAIVLPPFGALMGLQYGLTSAPASQPRNAIVGQTLGLSIAHLIGTYLELELWLRQSLATALAIGVMVKCGVIHPPAGAAAVVFSSGKMSWTQAGMMLVGNVLAILSSTLINNLNDKRQYPTFWGFRPINDFVSSFFTHGDKKAKTKERP